MKKLKIIIAFSCLLLTFALTAVLQFTSADSSSITFEPPTYTTGSIHGQDGWSSSGPFDHKVVDNDLYPAPASFSTQSLRISNAVTSGSFGNQTFSKSLVNEAGETSAENGGMSGGVRQSHYEVSFNLASAVPTAQQPGLSMSTSPDRGDGARMSYLRFEDQADGIHVFFDDYRDHAPFGTSGNPAVGCGIEDEFAETEIAVVDRATAHNFKIVMDFVDGPRNDIVKVYVDGILSATGTSWEDYFRYCEGNPTRTVDSLLFRTAGPAAPGTFGQGFLIDNLNSISSLPPATADQCKKNGWQGFTRANGSSFKNQGDCIQYVNTGK